MLEPESEQGRWGQLCSLHGVGAQAGARLSPVHEAAGMESRAEIECSSCEVWKQPMEYGTVSAGS